MLKTLTIKTQNQILNKEREERKKKEEEFVLIQHRLIVLKNQEKSKLLQLKNIKRHIDRIIKNRIKSQEKLNEKLIEKRNINKSIFTNISWIGSTNSNFINSNKSMSKSQNNFYNPKLKNSEIQKSEKNQKKNDFKQSLLDKIKKDQFRKSIQAPVFHYLNAFYRQDIRQRQREIISVGRGPAPGRSCRNLWLRRRSSSSRGRCPSTPARNPCRYGRR